MPQKQISRSPRWYGIPLRVLLLTFIGTLLTFAFSLMFAIAGLSLYWALHGLHPNMASAYRRIALPVSVVSGAVIFLLSVVAEVRRYRQLKTLSAIERVS